MGPADQSGSRRLLAVLGPTNTGKTHLAIERMLAHADGMIGLPLRLLAREVYDRVVKAKGVRAAALITGEEKIAPDTARYFICTVEAMPLERRTSFLAIDEIQLCADPDRGHIFTDRLLRARGTGETMLLGSDIMRPVLRRLTPDAEIQRRERLSTLSYAAPTKLTKLPKRTAIVAFSAEEVYAIAELIRRKRGGAAVVMGALSPRTRNAQVELYQSGEVDFLVATDAIGMGLNMDVDHVAFASRAKFDGRQNRPLRADEIAQIAGRAGRFRTDGTFGETGDCPLFDADIVSRVESHDFEPLAAIEWRNPDLEFASIGRLRASLAAPPREAGLVRTRGAIDEEALRHVSEVADVADLVRRPADVRRLWEVCQTPDFRKATTDEHARLLTRFALCLLKPNGRIPQDWIAKDTKALDRSEGELDTLQARLAHIRTWTYAANRPDWLDDCEHWRIRTREIEDKISDALHAALAQRFVDRRTSALMKSLKKEDVMLAGVTDAGEVTVEGHFVGRLEGLAFRPDPRAAGGKEAQAVRNAAFRALRPEVNRRLLRLGAEAALTLDETGRISAEGMVVARIAAGGTVERPKVTLAGGELGDPGVQTKARAGVEDWLARDVARKLGALVRLKAAIADQSLSPAARGLAFQLLEAECVLDRAAADNALAPLAREDRAALARLGVRIGRHSIFLVALLKPAAAHLHSVLRAAQSPGSGRPFLPRPGLVSAALEPEYSAQSYARAGFRAVGGRAIRFDALERLDAACRSACGAGRDFAFDPAMCALIGCSPRELEAILKDLGFRRMAAADAQTGAPAMWRPAAHRTPRRPRPAPAAPHESAGAFGGLAALLASARDDAQ